ncbi:MAG: ribonuclease J [Lachnospiraceae bacterium]|nr:ribonuclease J [Lachnospiraceae bacterium]
MNNKKELNSKKVKIIPLGGLDKIGMNITAFEYGDSIIVVDCGMSFPEEDMLGIDKVIPDVSYLIENREKVKGFLITHGHEDHIGALPYIIPQLNIPIYATNLTMGLINHKLEEAHLLKKTKRKVVKYGQLINLGEFRIEFIKTNHSIAEASALAIYSPAGIILHTGDFKIDYTPLFGDSIDLQRLGAIGKKGVLALMCDSTNAARPGFTPSETIVAKTFDSLFAENKNNRIIIATFASNVDRVQLIINTAYKFNRKVILQGRSMLNVIAIASELGYINLPDNTLIDINQMKNYPDEKLVFITTGSQGESMAALSRMADSSHKKVSIKPGDAIVFSSTPIPGNVKAVSKVMNELAIKGANVIVEDTHVSGHACQEEIKLMYSLLQPQYAIPVHGEFRHLMAQAKIAKELGTPDKNVFVLKIGEVLELSEEQGSVVGTVPAKGILVDGLGIGDVGNIVLHDRQNLAENGIIAVVVTLEKGTNHVLGGPDIVSRGFVYVRESEDLMKQMRYVVNASLDKCVKTNITDWSKIKGEIKDDLNSFLWKKLKRSPVVLPIITEV